MNDLAEKQVRYLRDALPVRLGNLASNLAHISSFARGGKNPNAVERLLWESRYFIEWTAAETEIETAAELVEMQVQLSWWYHHWQDEQVKPMQLTKITQQTRAWSDRVLDLSGLLQEAG
ncbi:MAG: hypothetical protein HC853_01435 [Anaerolineae bacterium]|nr:hypothetical protein [Anaerolineae bacterium]